MKLDSELRREALASPVANALLQYLLVRRSPTRVPVARKALSLSPGEFGLALRALERHGLAKRFRAGHAPTGDAIGRLGNLNRHLFVEATTLAFDLRPVAPTFPAGMSGQEA